MTIKTKTTTPTTTDHASLLASIQEQRATQPLSILTLAEPLLTPGDPHSPSPSSLLNHDSKDAINTINPDPNNSSSYPSPPSLDPQTLAADLQHYRDLFSKLRFSYLEQVTKEKYLRSIVGDPPVLVSHDQNLALEEQLTGMKAALKAKKTDNEKLVKEIEGLAARLAVRYQGVCDGVVRLKELPAEIEGLEGRVEELRERVLEKEREMDVDVDMDGDGNVRDAGVGLSSLQGTVEAVEEKRRRVREVEDQIRVLQGLLPEKIAECERVDGELVELETRRNEVTRLAGELRRRREEGGRDVLEDQGRWLKGQDAVLKGLLGISVDG